MGLSIQPARTGQQADALHLLFGHLPEQERSAVVTNLLADALEQQRPLTGLIEARREGELAGAAWTQVQAGATAVFWPPVLAANEPASTGEAMLAAAMEFVSTQHVALVQALLESDTSPEADRLRGAGFRHLARMLYLVSTQDRFPAEAPTSALSFEPFEEQHRDRLADVIRRTYTETRDCPALDGLRSIGDVIEGYQATGSFDPQRWLFAVYERRDIGCLLLTDHPGAGHWELIYMGLAPEARGRGFGMQIVRQAQWMTRQAGRPRLVLAVDAANRPAIRMYRSAGFTLWQQRDAFVRSLERESSWRE